MPLSQPLSQNEIRDCALRFARDWADASRERAEAQTFWNEFFNFFGLNRRCVTFLFDPYQKCTSPLSAAEKTQASCET